MSEPCEFKDTIIEMHGDIKKLVGFHENEKDKRNGFISILGVIAIVVIGIMTIVFERVWR